MADSSPQFSSKIRLALIVLAPGINNLTIAAEERSVSPFIIYCIYIIHSTHSIPIITGPGEPSLNMASVTRHRRLGRMSSSVMAFPKLLAPKPRLQTAWTFKNCRPLNHGGPGTAQLEPRPEWDIPRSQTWKNERRRMSPLAGERRRAPTSPGECSQVQASAYECK